MEVYYLWDFLTVNQVQVKQTCYATVLANLSEVPSSQINKRTTIVTHFSTIFESHEKSKSFYFKYNKNIMPSMNLLLCAYSVL